MQNTSAEFAIVPSIYLMNLAEQLHWVKKKQLRQKGKRIKKNLFTLTDARKIKQKMTDHPDIVAQMGYHPCTENIMYDLTFCDPLGINISTPPEVLHAILLGHGTRLLNAFARLQQIKSPKKQAETVDKEPRKAFVFSGQFGSQVEVELKNVGFWLTRQSDPDRTRTHFPSGYMPNASKKDDNTTEKTST